MNLFCRRLGERCADVSDWIDYRPDANFWPFFFLPPFVCAAAAYVGLFAFGIILAFALLATVIVAAFSALAVVCWIASKTILDVLPVIRLRTASGPQTSAWMPPSSAGNA